MKTTIITICLMLFGAITLQAQNLKWFRGENGKYGYKNDKGEIIVQPLYTYASIDFVEGIGIVRNEEGKGGYIDATGKLITPLKYDGASYFSEGLATVNIGGKLEDFGVTEGGKWGFIDKTGEEVITAKYEFTSLFKNGKAKVTLNGREFYIDKTGKEVK